MIRAIFAATAPLLVSASLAAAGGLAPPIIVPGAVVEAPVVVPGGGGISSPVVVEDGDVTPLVPTPGCTNLDAALQQLEGQGWSGFITTSRGADVLISANRGAETGQFVVACDPGTGLLSDDDDAGEGAAGGNDG